MNSHSDADRERFLEQLADNLASYDCRLCDFDILACAGTRPQGTIAARAAWSAA